MGPSIHSCHLLNFLTINLKGIFSKKKKKPQPPST